MIYILRLYASVLQLKRVLLDNAIGSKDQMIGRFNVRQCDRMSGARPIMLFIVKMFVRVGGCIHSARFRRSVGIV